MIDSDDTLASCSALVVDSNPTTSSILVAHLRDYGVGTVNQVVRTSDARRRLEAQIYDFVLCENHFPAEGCSGQDLLDDLRRNNLLPFSTVFIMITSEATYDKVAEAAESALDSYILKPHKASQLTERLQQARLRKESLREIFSAIDEENFELAANLCLERFENRAPFWLYAARVGAELLLRIGKPDAAQELYRAVIAAKTLPWAKLGVARAQLESGQINQATSTLEQLISENPGYTDAYDVMGRAQFESGQFDRALETYRMAATLTPSSISRLQNFAMMTFYAGQHEEAAPLLERSIRLGLESKMFDAQSLVLLAFIRLETNNRKGLRLCEDDLQRLVKKHPNSARLRHMVPILSIIKLLLDQQSTPTIEAVKSLAGTVKHNTFDFEAACNLLMLLSYMAEQGIQFDQMDALVETIGMRFCSNRSLTELLAASARTHDPYVEKIRTCHATVLNFSEEAMALSLAGQHTAAVQNLIFHASETLSFRLIDNAYQVLQRHKAKIQGVEKLDSAIANLRAKAGEGVPKASLGESKRQTGGLVIRTGKRKKTADSTRDADDDFDTPDDALSE